ncbi:hypothetical protein ACWEN6_12185 [Sphaerisporangium sp. NPDC004334]
MPKGYWGRWALGGVAGLVVIEIIYFLGMAGDDGPTGEGVAGAALVSAVGIAAAMMRDGRRKIRSEQDGVGLQLVRVAAMIVGVAALGAMVLSIVTTAR